jgi:hypothetical protein
MISSRGDRAMKFNAETLRELAELANELPEEKPAIKINAETLREMREAEARGE